MSDELRVMSEVGAMGEGVDWRLGFRLGVQWPAGIAHYVMTQTNILSGSCNP